MKNRTKNLVLLIIYCILSLMFLQGCCTWIVPDAYPLRDYIPNQGTYRNSDFDRPHMAPLE